MKQNKQFFSYFLTFLAFITIVTGCDSRHSNDNRDDNNLIINENNNSNQTAIIANEDINAGDNPMAGLVKTKGYLIDSPLSGVSYECDNSVALTDYNGTFECIAPPVTFRIGKLTLGVLEKFTKDSKVYPQDLLGISRNNFKNDSLKLLTRLIQSLDDDGDISERIIIENDIANKIKIDKHIRLLKEDEVKGLIESLGKTFIKECVALKHLGAKVECNSDGGYYVSNFLFREGSDEISSTNNRPSSNSLSTSSSLTKTFYHKKFLYDNFSRVVKEDLGNGKYIKYIYDKSGNLIRREIRK